MFACYPGMEQAREAGATGAEGCRHKLFFYFVETILRVQIFVAPRSEAADR